MLTSLYRDTCVLCLDAKLVPFIELPKFPVKCTLEKLVGKC